VETIFVAHLMKDYCLCFGSTDTAERRVCVRLVTPGSADDRMANIHWTAGLVACRMGTNAGSDAKTMSC
jgi:hypothetical protein